MRARSGCRKFWMYVFFLFVTVPTASDKGFFGFFWVESHRKADPATASGKFQDEIVPVMTNVKFLLNAAFKLSLIFWVIISRKNKRTSQII